MNSAAGLDSVSTGPAFLIVDDNPRVLTSTSLVARQLGARVFEAATGADALAIARAERLDLALVDNRLPDASGLGVGKTLRAERLPVPWILYSGMLESVVAHAAGCAGALRTEQMPFDVPGVLDEALKRIHAKWPPLPIRPQLRTTFYSVVEELACLIWLACESSDDVKTIRDWADPLKIGYSTLRGLCDRAGMNAESAKNFARILRALVKSNGRVADVRFHLRYGDDRTVHPLLERAGLSAPRTPERVTLEQYLVLQQFIGDSGPILPALRRVLETPTCGFTELRGLPTGTNPLSWMS